MKEVSPFLPVVMRTALIVLAVVICLGSYFVRGVAAGRLSPEALDWVQAARATAVHGLRPTTDSIAPLLTANLRLNPDGSLPDLGHAPLYLELAALGMRRANHTTMGLGDKVASLLSLLCFAGAAGAAGLLSRELFGRRGGTALAVLLAALSGMAVALAIEPHPATLAALLFTLLLLALARRDSAAGDSEQQARPGQARVAMVWAAAAGALYGLLYLTLYSALLLLPALVTYLYLSAAPRQRVRTLVPFLAAAVVVAAPQLIRAALLTHNPLFNAHLLDLATHTRRYPGDALLRQALPTETTGEFLASGGLAMVCNKTLGTLISLYREAPGALGSLLMPLFLGAALVRFSDGRTNRLRNLCYACLGCQLLGVAPFLSREDAVRLVVVYAPAAAVLGVAFLLNAVRSRRLTPLAERAIIGGWVLAACLPGIARIMAPTPSTDPIYDVYYQLNTDSPEMLAVRAQHGHALIAADAPAELAFRCDVPALWLPEDSAEWHQVEEQTGRHVVGALVTPAGVTPAPDREALPVPWTQTYDRINGLSDVAADLPAVQRRNLLRGAALHYPAELSDALGDFRPYPVIEQDGDSVSLLFWDRRLAGSDIPVDSFAPPATPSANR